MADNCPTARLYEELSGFIEKSGSKVSPSCETMHSLMCIITSSRTFVRDPKSAQETLFEHVGSGSYMGLSEKDCEALYNKIKPAAMMIDSRRREI